MNESRAAILGRESANLAVITVVTLPGGVQQDSFLGFWPSFSPDDRYVAFIKFFPQHIGYEYSLTDEYLVYDLRASPAENRTPANRAKPLKPDTAGWPFYPEGSANAPGDNILEGHDVPTHQIASDGFFWPRGADKLAFVDRFEGVNRLVVAELGRGVRDIRVRVVSLLTVEIIDLSRCKSAVAPSDWEVWARNAYELVHVTEIQSFGEEPGTLRLTFSAGPCLRSREVLISVDMP